MGMHVAIHFHPKKLGHAFYAYLQGLGIKDKESDIFVTKGMIDSLTIDANADADAILEAFNIIEDNWEQVPSLTQTEAASSEDQTRNRIVSQGASRKPIPERAASYDRRGGQIISVRDLHRLQIGGIRTSSCT